MELSHDEDSPIPLTSLNILSQSDFQSHQNTENFSSPSDDDDESQNLTNFTSESNTQTHTSMQNSLPPETQTDFPLTLEINPDNGNNNNQTNPRQIPLLRFIWLVRVWK